MVYFANCNDALSSTEIDELSSWFGAADKTTNLSQPTVGPNFTSGLTLMSVQSSINSCTDLCG